MIIIILVTCVFSCSNPTYTEPHVIIDTQFGEIELELFASKAPKTVAAFLATVDNGMYADCFFYRVLKAEQLPSDYNTGVIQGGTWQNKPGETIRIKHESTLQTGLSHTDGTISMARKDTGTASTEFFICIGDQSPLDHGRRGTQDGQGYAAFGKVFKGMSVVKKIHAQPSAGEFFVEKIKISSIKRL
jgi:peptidyl-prolyl cis-trans isomerase A (cyclophilin A)